MPAIRDRLVRNANNGPFVNMELERNFLGFSAWERKKISWPRFVFVGNLLATHADQTSHGLALSPEVSLTLHGGSKLELLPLYIPVLQALFAENYVIFLGGRGHSVSATPKEKLAWSLWNLTLTNKLNLRTHICAWVWVGMAQYLCNEGWLIP